MAQRFELVNEDCMEYAVQWPVTESGRDVEYASEELDPETLLILVEQAWLELGGEPTYDGFIEIEQWPNGNSVKSEDFDHTDWICEIEEHGWPTTRWIHWHDREWPLDY